MNSLNDIVDRIKNDISECDKVLIGIGKGLEYKSECSDESLVGFYYMTNPADTKTDNVYSKLYELVKDKDYRVISLCMDGKINSYFPEEKVVTPCGNIKKLQCDENCNGELYDIDDNARNIIAKIKSKETIIKSDYPVCPSCGKRMVINNILATAYNEEGYLDSFGEYKKWLQSTINKKLVILELGADMRYPSVIRLPFDKMCYYNQKSVFYRINDTLYQHTAENKQRGISVKADVKELFEYL